jgi:hypothetical protein
MGVRSCFSSPPTGGVDEGHGVDEKPRQEFLVDTLAMRRCLSPTPLDRRCSQPTFAPEPVKASAPLRIPRGENRGNGEGRWHSVSSVCSCPWVSDFAKPSLQSRPLRGARWCQSPAYLFISRHSFRFPPDQPLPEKPSGAILPGAGRGAGGVGQVRWGKRGKSRGRSFFRLRASHGGCFAKHPGQHAFWQNPRSQATSPCQQMRFAA